MGDLTIEEMCSILPDQNGSVELTSVGLSVSYRGDDMDCLEQVHFKANDKSGIVWPSSPLMAATFDKERTAARAALTGNEGIFMGCTEIGCGGPNFHRTQYCGRNNAYYSEDAALDYYIGQLMTENCQKYGVTLGYKHLTLNDQEYRRESIVTFLDYFNGITMFNSTGRIQLVMDLDRRHFRLQRSEIRSAVRRGAVGGLWRRGLGPAAVRH